MTTSQGPCQQFRKGLGEPNHGDRVDVNEEPSELPGSRDLLLICHAPGRATLARGAKVRMLQVPCKDPSEGATGLLGGQTSAMFVTNCDR